MGGARPEGIDRTHRPTYKSLVAVAQQVRSAAAEAGVERSLVELVNIRVSQMNGCAVCLDTHVRDALANGESTQRLAVLSTWRDADVFTAREGAALELAESITSLPDHATQERIRSATREHLSAEEFSAVAWVAITIGAFNRVSIVSNRRVRPAS
jgi:AhpD family alkylhydroperoxidase